MDAPTYNSISLYLWLFTLVVGLLTVTIYFFQLRKMDQSLKAQNLAWLIQYLQAPDVRHARFVVMTQLLNKPFSQTWSPEEKEQAATACAAYGTAAVFIELGRVDGNIIIENWGPSIRKVAEICDAFIADQRDKVGGQYWSALVSLNETVKEEPSKLPATTARPSLKPPNPS